MRKYIYILSTFLFLSCFNQVSKIEKVENSSAEDIEVEIVKKKSSYLNNNLILQNNNLKENFSEYELNEFKAMNISPTEVLKLIKKSKEGDVVAINTLSYVYYLIEDNVKLREVLEMGSKLGNTDSIFNLILLEIEDFNYDEALNLISKLPKGYKSKEIKNIEIEIYLDKATQGLRKKNNNEVLVNLIKAYNLGQKELDYEIAKIYKTRKDISNTLKWLNLSAKRNNIIAIKELAIMYSKMNDTQNAIKFYTILYNNGDIEYAKNIFNEYTKTLDNKNIIKWYNISKKLGLIKENSEIEKLIELYE
ncbi:MAG: hypothetical protein ACTTIS_04050 [Streptobacillus sp.]